MSEDKKTHDEVRIKPSIESLRLAVKLANRTGHALTEECIVRSAALFDVYLSGLIRFSVHDCDSLDNGFYNLLLGRIEVTARTAPYSHSETVDESLARPLSGLSVDELQQITSQNIKPWFKERAEAELALRKNEGDAS